MQKLLMLMALVFSFSVASAQVQRASKPKMAKDSMAMPIPADMKQDKQGKKQMIKALGLTRQQKIQFKEIQQNNKVKKAAIENDNTLGDTEKKEKLRALRRTQMQTIDGILNEEQREKMKEIRKEKMKGTKENKDAKMEMEEEIE